MRARVSDIARRQCRSRSWASGVNCAAKSLSETLSSEGSNSTRIRKVLESWSPCSSACRILPPCSKMNPETRATTPLRSGQLRRRMADFFMDCLLFAKGLFPLGCSCRTVQEDLRRPQPCQLTVVSAREHPHYPILVCWREENRGANFLKDVHAGLV